MDFPSRIGLGTWQFSAVAEGLPSPSEAAAIFRAAWDLGVRHLDTAQSYGAGVSETVLGGILRESRGVAAPREAADPVDAAAASDVFIATKIHYKPGVEDTLAALRESLMRLGRARLDLVYLHWPRKGLDVRPVMEGLERARELGLIRHVGASNFSVAELEAAAEVSRVDAFQIGYSLLWRYPEREVLPYCREKGIAVVTYSALAQGLLAGRIKERTGFARGDPRPDTVFYDEGVFPHVQAAIAKMEAAAATEGLSLARAALAWVLGRPGIGASLLGAKAPAQLADILGVHGKAEAGARPDARAGDGLANIALRHPALMDRLTEISDALMPSIPDVGNIFRANP
jgi:aryl-alcohol dehydrogenase-like predicted oxidoreductase